MALPGPTRAKQGPVFKHVVRVGGTLSGPISGGALRRYLGFPLDGSSDLLAGLGQSAFRLFAA